MRRVMVDMSATLLHHGHIRLLKKASEMGYVVVTLTTDESILEYKGYKPELSYEERKEIIESLKYVQEVVPCPWILDDEYVDRHNCEVVVHGEDNFNHISPEKMVIFPRTEGISSSDLRERVLDILMSLNLTGKKSTGAEKLARMMIETIKKEFKLE